MSRTGVILFSAALMLGLVSQPMAHGEKTASRRVSLATVEGIIDGVETVPGEGGGEILAVNIRTEDPEPRELKILLAPERALEEIGFTVAEGDRLRARIFLSGEDPAPAQRVMNMTRGTIVRLRTLTRIPVWNSAGQWQGGACRDGQGWATGAPHRRGGGGGRRN
jgi:hypothetical protein